MPLDYPAAVACDWPDLLKIAEERVKPERQRLGDNGDARRPKGQVVDLWGRYTPALYAAIAGLNRALVNSQVSAHHQFALVPANSVLCAHSLRVCSGLATPPSASCSRGHTRSGRDSSDRRWKIGSATHPSDCFETFPFPGG